MPDQAIAQRQFLTKVDGIVGYWRTFSGGEVSQEHTKQHDGGSLVPDIFSGNPMVSDITVTRAYRPGRDGPIRAELAGKLAGGKAVMKTITRTPTDEDYTPIAGAKDEVFECRLKSVTPSDADANSADSAVFQLVFTVRSAK